MIRGIVFAVLVVLGVNQSTYAQNTIDAVTSASGSQGLKIKGGKAYADSAEIIWWDYYNNGQIHELKWGTSENYDSTRNLKPFSARTDITTKIRGLKPNTKYFAEFHRTYQSKNANVTTKFQFTTAAGSAAANKPPVFTSAAAVACTTGKTLDYTAVATDADNDPVTFTASGLPNWITFASPKLTLKPVSGSTGTTVKIVAGDGKSGFDTLSLVVTVVPLTGIAQAAHAALPAMVNFGDLHFSVPNGENVRVSLFALNGSAIYCQTVAADKLAGTFDNLSTSTTPGVYLLTLSSPSLAAQHTVSISK